MWEFDEVTQLEISRNKMGKLGLHAGMNPEEEWYNKSLSALRMNTSHHHQHQNLATTQMLQYQT